MKQLNIMVVILCFMANLGGACKSEPDSKAIRREVLNLHDKVMIDGGKLIKNKMKLNTLLRSTQIKSTREKQKIAHLMNRLNKADEMMMDWMHFFRGDFKGKSEQENLAYYKSEMIKIRTVEDVSIKAISASDSILKAYQIKPAEPIERHVHQH